jgi:ribokinase
MSQRIVVVGSTNTDMIVKTPRLPRPGETVLGGEFAMAAGGKGANQAVAAARAGGDVLFVSRVGTDPFGDQAVAGLITDGIDVSQVHRDPSVPSGTALIIVDDLGENLIAVASGANGRLSLQDIDAAGPMIATSRILVLQLEVPLEVVEAAARLAAEHRVQVILNPAPATPLGDDLLKNVSIITPNEHEAELLTGVNVDGESGATRAAGILHSLGVQTVIITLGSKGAFVSAGGLQELIPGFPVKAVDTTAAGDVFNGALAVALAEAKPLADSVRFANAAAACSVTLVGAQPSIPMRARINQILQDFPRGSAHS